VKKCMEYEVEGARPRGRPKKTWREIVEKDCRARGLNTEDAVDRSRWNKQIGMIDDHDVCVCMVIYYFFAPVLTGKNTQQSAYLTAL